jgi:hypothetical protein
LFPLREDFSGLEGGILQIEPVHSPIWQVIAPQVDGGANENKSGTTTPA